MNLKEEFPSKWLKGDDLGDNPVTVTIEDVTIEEFDNSKTGGKDRKIALHFRGKEKGLICNVGMRATVQGFYGDDTDDWIGKQIKIMAVPFTSDKGQTSMVCRVHPKKPGSSASPAQPAEPKPTPPEKEPGETADDIPF
jgi:hypothetical protein